MLELCEELCYNIAIPTGDERYLKGEQPMEFSYNKLWKLLIDKNMIKKDLMTKTHITSSTIAKMGKNKAVSMEVLGKICMALNCDIGDIVEVMKD